MPVRLSPRGQAILLAGLSAIGFVMCLAILIDHGIFTAGGYGGGDVFAYYWAGTHLRLGEPLYGTAVGGYAAYLYPPVLAQLFVPLSLLPFPVVVWIWRGVELVGLRVAVGSWRNAGLALLLWPPAVSELDAANVHLLVAGAVGMAIRSDGSAIAPIALTKFASLAAVPLALARDRRGLAIGAGVALGVVAVSFVLAPELWVSYVQFLPSATQPEGYYNIGNAVPLWLRFAIAGLCAIAALRLPRLAAVAATLAYPVLWLHGLSTLVAVAARPVDAARRIAAAEPAAGPEAVAPGLEASRT